MCIDRNTRNSKKISVTHVNEALIDRIQTAFLVVYIKEMKYYVFNILYVGTRYGERVVAESRNGSYMMDLM